MKKMRLVLKLSFAVIFIAILVFFFGRPTWHKSIYMFQCYYWPEIRGIAGDGWIYPPTNYTGILRKWHADGTLWTECGYKNGKAHGMSKTYWAGKLTDLACYTNGKRDGFASSWYGNGFIADYSPYRNDELHGAYIQNFEENGMPRIMGQYFNGQKHGTWTLFDLSGVAIKVARYDHGKLLEGSRAFEEPEDDNELIEESPADETDPDSDSY